MTYRKRTRDEHLRSDGSPKRILALDGGGLRGVLSLGFLDQIEEILRGRHGGDKSFRLSHYFDLIAGTSTGSIIAAALALGWSVQEIRKTYFELGENVFEKSLFRLGLFRAKYDESRLSAKLRTAFGKNSRGGEMKLGDPDLDTGLLVMTKRIDTGSPWPISNNPRGKYFASRPKGTIGNGDYPLWQVVRASTAAPSYFEPETIKIAELHGHSTQEGEFVDGGISPFNNPALQAVMYATMDGYRIGWPTGADRLLVVSVGTGAADPTVEGSWLAAKDALKSLLALMNDCAALQETLLQWMSSSPTARSIDRELGTLQHDLVAPAPLLSYLRYDVDLRAESVLQLKPNLDDGKIADLSTMDSPENMEVLAELGVLGAQRQVRAGDFASHFDLAS